MRARITHPDSLFRGEEGTVLRHFEESGLGSPAYLIALDERGFGEQRLGLAFAADEVVILESNTDERSIA